MTLYNEHFLLNEETAIEYIKEKTDYFTEDDLICEEIGDGNINYVFRVKSLSTDKSLIIKQADKKTRSGGNPIDIDRNRIEAEILILQGKYAPRLVPKIYSYDENMSCMIMEDLKDYEIMRYALMDYKIFPNFAEDISDFLVNTLIPTTDLVLNHKEKKRMVGKFINPDLCDITERMVYTYPYIDYANDNRVYPNNEDFVKQVIYDDKKLHLEIAKLKDAFMNHSQALIHGDLHTGSIFINESDMKVIDPEFAFYGPIGYDMGNVIANILFAWMRAQVMLESSGEKTKFLNWATDTVENIIKLFKEKFIKAYREKTTDVLLKTPGFEEYYLNNILCDTASVVGLEIIRRIIGDAKVADIDSIDDRDKRTLAERTLLLAGKEFILNRCEYTKGSVYIGTISKMLRKISE